jgi:hypothetical protein
MIQRQPCAQQLHSVRRAGAMHTFDSINHFFLIGQILGQNMAWRLKKIHA